MEEEDYLLDDQSGCAVKDAATSLASETAARAQSWDHTRFVGTLTRRPGVESRRLRTGEVVVVVD